MTISIPTSLPIMQMAQAQGQSRQLLGTPSAQRNNGAQSNSDAQSSPPSTFDSLLASLAGKKTGNGY